VFCLDGREQFQRTVVFKEWVLPWVKRGLIKNAIEIVSPGSLETMQSGISGAQDSTRYKDNMESTP